MEQYAIYYGAWSSYHHSYTWQKLEVACTDLAVTVEGEAHRATADALSALAVLKSLAALNREGSLEAETEPALAQDAMDTLNDMPF